MIRLKPRQQMGLEWAEPHLDWNCLNVQILGPLFKL
ncbi:rCG44329 [Rattus norvegicus]|uniref:RCG44329 n=1 Tax=Rattus norvegicus TaxID=10116 RepID=A6KDD6_RAT|nr:rCG44329 [Rattus norvegicus]